MSSTLYRHGAVHTSADPFAEALLVEDGVVAWLGADDTADGLVARADEVIDLEGALVAPAFVDAHVHVLETGLALESIDLSAAGGVRSLADALDAVTGPRRPGRSARRTARCSASAGTSWSGPRGGRPTRHELDAAAGGAPVYLARVDVHSAVVSSALTACAGADVPPTAGASTAGSSGTPTTAPAGRRARSARPDGPGCTDGRWQHAASRGIVSVHEQSRAVHRHPGRPARAPGPHARPGRRAARISSPTAASCASRSTTRASSSPRSRA